MDLEKALDVSVAIGLIPFAIWMALTGRILSTVGILLLSFTAVLRLTLPGIREWTDEHQWLFLAILLPMLLLAFLGAMPPN